MWGWDLGEGIGEFWLCLWVYVLVVAVLEERNFGLMLEDGRLVRMAVFRFLERVD